MTQDRLESDVQDHAGAHATSDSLNRSENADPYKWHAIGVVLLSAITLPGILGMIIAAQPEPTIHPWATVAANKNLSPSRIALGETAYQMGCSLCHGKDADGVARLGKPLRNSAYVQDHTDDELFSVITTGRLPTDPENTTGSAMPARGTMNLGDDELRSVIHYLRAIQDPSQPVASVEEWDLKTGDSMEILAGGAGGVGHDLFVSSCSSCHGAAGEGLEGLGKPLTSSEFIEGKTDEELIAFIKSGRPIWDAENTTGIDMPPKGGNPAITDEQLNDIIAFIRSMHK